ncbi:MAG: ribosome maturation factor RimM [Rhodospirillaceae bacterium]
MAPDDADPLVCLGVITGPRGLKGDLRIKSFTQDPRAIADYGELTDEAGERRFRLTITGEAKGVLVGRVDGVTDRTGAEKLKGARLYVDRGRLPEPDEDEYYHSDLIGLRAETPEGDLGTVKQVFEFGAGDVLEISGGGHGTVMVPFTKAVVPVVDIKGGRLVIDPPDGLLETPERPDTDETPTTEDCD